MTDDRTEMEANAEINSGANNDSAGIGSGAAAATVENAKASKKHDIKVVGDYEFWTVEDAKLAADELKKVNYLRQNLKNDNPAVMKAVYTKALTGRLFRTPIGTDFLVELRKRLINSGDKSVSTVPLFASYAEPVSIRERAEREAVKARIKVQQNREVTAGRLRISIFLNIILALAVVAMFVITLSSPNANMLNYEKALINQYSSWEDDLKAREQTVRLKEREYNLSNP